MGICGSAGKKEDEVFTRGSFSARSLSGDETLQHDEYARKFAETQASRKRLTLQGNMVGQMNLLQSAEEIERQQAEVQKVEAPINRTVENLPDCHYVALSKKGFVPYDEKVNQDAVLCLELVEHNVPEVDMHYFGVLDGHGHHGRNVSQHVVKTFPVALTHELSGFTELEDLTDENITTALRNSIRTCAAELKQTNIPLQHSGTTFCGSLIFNNTVYTCQVGDSQGMMVVEEPGKWTVKDLCILHCPELPSERKRIRAAGGVVAQLPGIPTEEAGPFRVWLEDMSGPGLAMARSLGDELAHTVGVSDEPTFDIKKINENCRYLLWASDGVFEFLTTRDVGHILMSDNSLQDKAKTIVKQSVKRWRRFDTVVDDISVVILQLPADEDLQMVA